MFAIKLPYYMFKDTGKYQNYIGSQFFFNQSNALNARKMGVFSEYISKEVRFSPRKLPEMGIILD